MGGSGAGRPIGRTRDTGYQIGVRRTLPVPPAEAWRLVTSRRGLAAWLGPVGRFRALVGSRYRLADGTTGEIRVVAAGSHMRLSYHPPSWPRASILQVRVVPSGDACVVAFHQEHLPASRYRESRRSCFLRAIDELRRAIPRSARPRGPRGGDGKGGRGTA